MPGSKENGGGEIGSGQNGRGNAGDGASAPSFKKAREALESVRLDPRFDRIRAEMNRPEDVSSDRHQIDWEVVADLSSAIISDGGKDLLVGAWLGAALVQLSGLIGLDEALSVMGGLCRDHWSGMEPSAGRPAGREAIFSWWEGKIRDCLSERKETLAGRPITAEFQKSLTDGLDALEEALDEAGSGRRFWTLRNIISRLEVKSAHLSLLEDQDEISEVFSDPVHPPLAPSRRQRESKKLFLFLLIIAAVLGLLASREGARPKSPAENSPMARLASQTAQGSPDGEGRAGRLGGSWAVGASESGFSSGSQSGIPSSVASSAETFSSGESSSGASSSGEAGVWGEAGSWTPYAERGANYLAGQGSRGQALASQASAPDALVAMAPLGPCPQSPEGGEGTVGGEWLELYPEPGRWRLSVPLEGTVGPVKVSHYLAQAAPVTALDVVGRYLPKGRTRLSSSREGPVRAVVLGIHQGFMRISVNYAPLRRPKFAAASVGCARERGAEVLVLELDFEEMEEAGQADKSLEGDDGAHGGESAESEEGGLTSGRGA